MEFSENRTSWSILLFVPVDDRRDDGLASAVLIMIVVVVIVVPLL